MAISGELYKTIIDVVDLRMKEIKVHREDFDDLKSTIRNLASSQNELARIQARTETSLEKLSQAQARTEKRVEELSQAQARTDKSLKALAQAQTRTEKRMEELAKVQAETKKELKNLARQVGGLSEKLGGSLEDISYDVLPGCLYKYYQIEVDELGRDYLPINGQSIEVNIFGEGKEIATGKPITIVGEVKTNFTLTEVKRFVKLLEKIRDAFDEEVFPLLFGFRIHLDARELAKANNIRMFVSYGKEIK